MTGPPAGLAPDTPAAHEGPGDDGPALAFVTILFPGDGSLTSGQLEEPEYFRDLNIDQIVDSVLAGRDFYDLRRFFLASPGSVDAVRYRQEVLRDLERGELRAGIDAFAERMQHMRERLAMAAKLREPYQRERLFLDAIVTYGDAVRSLSGDLRLDDLSSRGLLAFREYVAAYSGSGEFSDLCVQARHLAEALSGVRYCLSIKGNRVRVSKYDDEPDYSNEVRATFTKFKRGDVRDYRSRFSTLLEMDHVEAGILQLVARLYPELFEALDQFCERHRHFADGLVERFDREVQFYLAYLDYIAPLRKAGLSFCYPEVSADSKDVSVADTFDLALARKLVSGQVPVICNDVQLHGPEWLLVITGPNQGGKTTFARTFGQLHYLAGLGFLVPGRDARVFLASGLLTHFEREEDLANLSGKLQDDLQRIHRLLQEATGGSVIILNEIFTSTTPADALYLSTKILAQVAALDSLCACVTFLDELASFSPATVSMVSMVDPDDPARRTFKVIRRPADGIAYAAAIADKYGLTYDRVRARVTV